MLNINQLSFSQTSEGTRTLPWSQTLRHAGQSDADDHWQVAYATLVEAVDRRQRFTMIRPRRKMKREHKEIVSFRIICEKHDVSVHEAAPDAKHDLIATREHALVNFVCIDKSLVEEMKILQQPHFDVVTFARQNLRLVLRHLVHLGCFDTYVSII
jgi:hypothetical protein